MKTIFTTLLIIIGLSASAQDTTWTKSDTKLYGSKAEKAHQEMIAEQSANHFLCRYIGFTEYYTNKLTSYLQLKQDYSFDDNSPNVPGYVICILSKNGISTRFKFPKMVVRFSINKQRPITSGKITGSFNELVDLFLNYWPQDANYNSSAQFQPGVSAIKHCYGDLISFKWVNGKPQITITKDPNMTVPVPGLAASIK